MHHRAKKVHESYIRAGSRSFIEAFYDRLIQASDEIRDKFRLVEMEAQIDALAHAIVMSFLFVDKNHLLAARTMDNVRDSHSRHNLDIKPHLHDIWLECIIETVRECDPQADDELIADWHAVMSHAVKHVRNGY